MKARSFVEELSASNFVDTFNPYSDICSTHDMENANHIRSRNLEKVLNSIIGKEIDALWIGRDLGYRGGRRTGLALTDEGSLAMASRNWGAELKRATKGVLVKERTASCIWNVANKIDKNLFMWNVFPFHPYEPGNHFSNRAHSRIEREFGIQVLLMLIELLKPLRIVAIGNDAYSSAVRMFDSNRVIKVRHPSYGGERSFYEQIYRCYELGEEQKQLFEH